MDDMLCLNRASVGVAASHGKIGPVQIQHDSTVRLLITAWCVVTFQVTLIFAQRFVAAPMTPGANTEPLLSRINSD
jgi:hypothetical protein